MTQASENRGQGVGPGRSGERDGAPSDGQLAERIRALYEEARLPVDVDVRQGVARLVGRVDSPRLHQAALDLAQGIPGITGIDDQIDYEVIAPDMATEPPDDDMQFGYVDPDAAAHRAPSFEPENDMVQRPDTTLFNDDVPDDEPDFMEPVSSFDFQRSVDEAEPWFPPTDPVVEPSSDSRGLEIVGGFQYAATEDTDQLEDEAVADATELGDGQLAITRSDDDLREDVTRELHEDASTTALRLNVQVINGVVYLRGRVQTMEDADNAESVAARVPGVVEVRDMTEVAALE